MDEFWVERQSLKPTSEGAATVGAFLCPGEGEELGLWRLARHLSFFRWALVGIPLPLLVFLPSSPHSYQWLSVDVLGLVCLAVHSVGVVMEELSGRIVVAARGSVVALSATLVQVFSSIGIHVSGEALLASALGTDKAVAAASLVSLQDEFY